MRRRLPFREETLIQCYQGGYKQRRRRLPFREETLIQCYQGGYKQRRRRLPFREKTLIQCHQYQLPCDLCMPRIARELSLSSVTSPL